MASSEEERRTFAAAQWSGMAAVLYVTDPERWTGFAAFAEQWMPGSTWGEADRLAMRADAEILRRLAEMAEP
jgi:hypothetical protein